MEESITLDQGERILRKREKQNQYPGVGTRSRPSPLVEDVEHADEPRPMGAPVEIDIHEPDTPDKDAEARKGSRKMAPRKGEKSNLAGRFQCSFVPRLNLRRWLIRY